MDVSQAHGSAPVLAKVFELILTDSAIDLLLVQEDMGILLQYMPYETVKVINNSLIDLRTSQDKPIVVVLPPGLSEMQPTEIERKLSKCTIPVFPTIERAAKAIRNLSLYSHFQTMMKSQ